jgi:hypothetical protein
MGHARHQEEPRRVNDPTGTFLSTFTARGGRLLVYQGVADPVFSARDRSASKPGSGGVRK